VLELGQTDVMHHRDLDRDQADGVAVGWRLGDRVVADHARAAGAVDHVERLLQFLFQQRGDDARRCVGAAARSPGHDELHRALRVLRLRCRRNDDQQQRENSSHDSSSKGCLTTYSNHGAGVEFRLRGRRVQG
jgi:hypothetical protein